MQHKNGSKTSFYRPRNPEASSFFKVVRDHFDEFESVYPERYQDKYGYWRPVIRTSIDKFLKCGDLKEGFARVRCPDCKEAFFVAFSCRQRGTCPSCDQSRSVAETTLREPGTVPWPPAQRRGTCTGSTQAMGFYYPETVEDIFSLR